LFEVRKDLIKELLEYDTEELESVISELKNRQNSQQKRVKQCIDVAPRTVLFKYPNSSRYHCRMSIVENGKRKEIRIATGTSIQAEAEEIALRHYALVKLKIEEGMPVMKEEKKLLKVVAESLAEVYQEAIPP
jgi:hypothetical protein